MMPEDYIDGIVRDVLDQAAVDLLEDRAKRLDIAYPPSSDPGENPHRRTGDLKEKVEYEIQQTGSVTMLTVTETSDHAAFLENGTSRMAARPHMGPLRDDWAPQVVERLSSAFSGPAVAAA